MCVRSEIVMIGILLSQLNLSLTCQENPNASPREIQELLWKQWTATSEEAGNEGSQAGPAKKKAKKEKKTKDPLAPKKPVTPFMLFFHSMKAGVRKNDSRFDETAYVCTSY